MRSSVSLPVLALLGILAVGPACAESPADGANAPAAASSERCEHGVQKKLCTRCNPKLAAVYKAKGDWCAEHARAESQCVICHPELAEKGVK